MDFNVLKSLGISETEPAEVVDALESLQVDLEQRLESVEDENRIAQLQDKRKKVEEQLVSARKAMQESAKTGAAKHGEIPRTVKEEEKKKVIPATVSDAEKKALEAKSDAKKFSEKDFEKQKKQHEDELKRQAKEINSQKKAEQKAKEKEEKKEEEKAEKEQKATEASSTDSKAPSEATVMEQEFKAGVEAFYRGEHAKAAPLLEKIANKGDAAHMEKKDIATAEFLVGMLYSKGLGGKKQDVERANFWFERAANHNNIEACMEYAMYFNSLKPTTAQDVKNAVDNALKYFKKAADLGKADAKTKYIALVELQSNVVSVMQKRTACKYIDEMIAAEGDDYIKQKWKERKEKIQSSGDSGSNQGGKTKSSKKKTKWFLGTFDGFTIVGSLILAYGLCLVNKGVFYGTSIPLAFKNLPTYDDEIYWIICADPMWSLNRLIKALFESGQALEFALSGIFAAGVGSIILGIGRGDDNGMIATILKEIVTVFLYVTCIFGIFGSMAAGVFDRFGDASGISLIVFAVVMLARVVGMVIIAILSYIFDF